MRAISSSVERGLIVEDGRGFIWRGIGALMGRDFRLVSRTPGAGVGHHDYQGTDTGPVEETLNLARRDIARIEANGGRILRAYLMPWPLATQPEEAI
jgi:hypothetical protein